MSPNYEKTEFHWQAAVVLQPKRDVSVVIIYEVTTDKKNNWKYFLRSLSSIKRDPILNHFQFDGGWDNWCIQQGVSTGGFRQVAEDPTVHEDFLAYIKLIQLMHLFYRKKEN